MTKQLLLTLLFPLFCAPTVLADPGARPYHEIYNEADRLQRAGQLDAAIEKFRLYVDLNPDADAHFSLGKALQENGNLQAARREFELAAGRDPSKPEYRQALIEIKNHMAAILVESAQRKETIKQADGGYNLSGAIADYEAALKLSNKRETHWALFKLYARTGNDEKAKEHARRALQMAIEGESKDPELKQLDSRFGSDPFAKKRQRPHTGDFMDSDGKPIGRKHLN